VGSTSGFIMEAPHRGTGGRAGRAAPWRPAIRLTFDSYADLRDLLAELPHRGDARVLVLRGAGRAFCSGGDVHEIIGATLAMGQDELLAFTRMTGEVIRGMRECPIPIVAGLQGMAAGAGGAGPGSAATTEVLLMRRPCHPGGLAS
jgi:1,4-dihydroxy-2-naphthoyl-CoA synthase